MILQYIRLMTSAIFYDMLHTDGIPIILPRCILYYQRLSEVNEDHVYWEIPFFDGFCHRCQCKNMITGCWSHLPALNLFWLNMRSSSMGPLIILRIMLLRSFAVIGARLIPQQLLTSLRLHFFGTGTMFGIDNCDDLTAFMRALFHYRITITSYQYPFNNFRRYVIITSGFSAKK